jgi:hypothetical protein
MVCWYLVGSTQTMAPRLAQIELVTGQRVEMLIKSSWMQTRQIEGHPEILVMHTRTEHNV